MSAPSEAQKDLEAAATLLYVKHAYCDTLKNITAPSVAADRAINALHERALGQRQGISPAELCRYAASGRYEEFENLLRARGLLIEDDSPPAPDPLEALKSKIMRRLEALKIRDGDSYNYNATVNALNDLITYLQAQRNERA